MNATARICATAASGEIRVSDAVHGLCDGSEFRFSAVGDVELRGIEQPMRLHRVDWGAGEPGLH